MRTASFVLKIVGASLIGAGVACLVVGFGEKIFGTPYGGYDEY